MTNSIAAAYRSGDLTALFRRSPAELAEATQSDWPALDRAALSAALREYHQTLGTLNPQTEAVLTRLAHPRCRVVVTGQQAGVLGGPSYSVHKGASALLLARQLSTDEAPVVAVYWVASQDHDTDEVAGTTLLDHAETLHRLHLKLPPGQMVGRIAWQPDWTAAVNALLDRFETRPEYREAARNRLTAAIQGSGAVGSLADVFARLIHGLLGPRPELKDGLLVLDPLFPALARLMAPAIAHELADPLAGPTSIEAAAATLEAQGYTPQLRRPAGATNLFLETDTGERVLLRHEGQRFEAGGQRYSREDLLALLNTDPTRITPAAGLRPIIQDTLLPTLAFVVGPGEIGYGAQLGEVYRLHGLKQPLLWPRLSVTWLESNVARLLARFGVTAAQFQADPEGTLGRALARQRGAAAVSGETLAGLHATFERLTHELGELDPTLSGAAERTGRRSLAMLERLQRLATAALARSEDTRTGQLTRLSAHLLPNGVPQEREMNFLTYLLKHGDEPLRELLAQEAGGAVELVLH